MRCGAGVRTCFARGGPRFRSQPRGPTRGARRRACPRRPRPSGARGGGETAIARRPRGVASPPPRGQGAARPGSVATPGARPEHQPGAHISTSQTLHVSYVAPQISRARPRGAMLSPATRLFQWVTVLPCHDAPSYGGPPDGGPPWRRWYRRLRARAAFAVSPALEGSGAMPRLLFSVRLPGPKTVVLGC
jgi:hypothetical protein